MHATPGAGDLREKRPGIVAVLRIETTRHAHALVFQPIPGLLIKKKTCFPGWDQQVKGLRAELERRSALLHRAEPGFVVSRHVLCRRRGCAGLGHQQIRTEQGLSQDV